MKITETSNKPNTVESIQGTHLRRLKPETHTRQTEKREELIIRSESDRIQGEKSVLNAFSMEIRAADKALETAEARLERLYGDMLGVIKQYPPYPSGSEERVERLKGITALRKEIDQLTIPPVEQTVVDSATGDQGSRTKTTEALTVGIPELSPSASDPEIRQAMEAVRDSTDAVRKRRQMLENEADAFLRHEARIGLWQRFFEGIPGIDSAPAAESAAIRTASSLNDLQARDGVRSLTSDGSPLTDFLG